MPLRIKQFQWACDCEKSLSLARCLVSGKIRNCRTMIKRNGQDAPGDILNSLSGLADEAERAARPESLLGIEGSAEEAYFSPFNVFLKSKASDFSFLALALDMMEEFRPLIADFQP